MMRHISTTWKPMMLLLTVLFSFRSSAQTSFQPTEYLILLGIYHQQSLAAYPAADNRAANQADRRATIADSVWLHPNLRLIYRSPDVGLSNSWDLWIQGDSLAIVSVRGTVNRPDSWLENFWAAMVPAQGEWQINDSTRFVYRLADDPRAAVHAGWLLGVASMAPDIVRHLHQVYQQGIRQVIITGHSQGGVISYLLAAYLHYLPDPVVADSLQYQVYASAAPRPGNLYFAYDFDEAFRGRAFHIVNPEDWVPQTPLTVQTLHDMAAVNPFADVSSLFQGSNWLVRWYLRSQFNKLKRRTDKANRMMTHLFGSKMQKAVKHYLPQLRFPVYAHSVEYTSAGMPVVLKPDSVYFQKAVFNGKNYFVHHALSAYAYLVKTNFHIH
ncbi:MAG: lipase family protein [Thermoflavifilum aggregans]|nr:lipase family protein [Thermoflavifilum aggregans]